MNRKKFKELTLKQKIGWLIEYYGLAALVGVVALVVIIFFIKAVIFPKPLPDVNIYILSDEIRDEDEAKIEGDLNAIIEGGVDVVRYGVSEEYGTSSFAMKISTDQIDIVLAPENEVNSMVETGYLYKYEKLEGVEGAYLGVPVKARQGESLDTALEYMRDYFVGIK